MDASTQKLLNRGSKLTELLKQNQYSPLTVAEQVVVIYSGVKGFLDDIDLNKIREFENKLLDKIKSDNMELLNSIDTTGKLDENNELILTKIIEDLKK